MTNLSDKLNFSEINRFLVSVVKDIQRALGLGRRVKTLRISEVKGSLRFDDLKKKNLTYSFQFIVIV